LVQVKDRAKNVVGGWSGEHLVRFLHLPAISPATSGTRATTSFAGLATFRPFRFATGLARSARFATTFSAACA
jgi:hypothetical protein